MQMLLKEKCRGFIHLTAPKVTFRLLVMVVILHLFAATGFSQSLDSLLRGNWFEVQQKAKKRTVPLQIQLKEDRVACYINLYPERSYNLKWFVTSDSILGLSNGERYKILSVGAGMIRMKKGAGPGSKVFTLKKGNRF